MNSDQSDEGRSAPDTEVPATSTPAEPMLEDGHPRSDVFVGSSLGPLRFDQTVYWHDGPIIFTVTGQEADGAPAFYLAVCTGEDRDLKRFDHALFRLTPEERVYLNGNEEVARFNDVSRKVLERDGKARFIRCDWTNWRVLEERDIDPAEAEERAIGDDGPMEPGQSLPPGYDAPPAAAAARSEG